MLGRPSHLPTSQHLSIPTSQHPNTPTSHPPNIPTSQHPNGLTIPRSKMRLFSATSFPAETLRSLNERVTMVKSKLPKASWVRPETQHLTFAFLGEQDE